MKDVFQTLLITKRRMSECATKEKLMDEYYDYRVYVRLMHIRGGRLSYATYKHLIKQIKAHLVLCEQGLK